MLGEFMVRCLLMLFGYAYPALLCYKTVVQSRIQIRELQFWCQFCGKGVSLTLFIALALAFAFVCFEPYEFEIIVAILTVVERIADTLVAWLPMYGELKLALFIYLWYPKTKGTGYVFETLLRPLVDKHEIDIEQKMVDWRVKGWDLALFYWKNCTELSESAIVKVFNYMTKPAAPQPRMNGHEPRPSAPPEPPSPPPRPNDLPSFFDTPPRQTKGSSKSKGRKWFSLPGYGGRRSTATAEEHDHVPEFYVQFSPLHDQTNYFYEDQNHNQGRYRGSKKTH